MVHGADRPGGGDKGRHVGDAVFEELAECAVAGGEQFPGVELFDVLAEHEHRQSRMALPRCDAPYVDRATAQSYRLVVLFLAYTGVRWGEMAALRVGRLDLVRRRAAIVQSMTVVRGVATWGTPEGHDRREVPVPRFLIEELEPHVATKQPDELVFTGVKGGPLRSKVFQEPP